MIDMSITWIVVIVSQMYMGQIHPTAHSQCAVYSGQLDLNGAAGDARNKKGARKGQWAKSRNTFLWQGRHQSPRPPWGWKMGL